MRAQDDPETKPACPLCNTLLTFRRWSKRRPERSEALADCPNGCGCWQIRYADGHPTSGPYQVSALKAKTVAGSFRITPARLDEIVRVYGSVQSFLDYAPVLVCNTARVNT